MGNQRPDPGVEGGGGDLERRDWVETSSQIQDKDAPLGGGEMRDSGSAKRRGAFLAEQNRIYT